MQAAQVEMNNKQRQVAANNQYVGKQITDAVNPIITEVMREKGASIALDQGATLQAAGALDVTQVVLQRLNAKLPSVNINAPAVAASSAGR
jgi:Skp family chaperone for outer membrane proteins